MLEIRIHGRGGQGSVTAAELLSMAAFADGMHAQAFPHFGVERRGAPVQAYVRLADEPIRLREHIYSPDIVVVQDPTLLEVIDVFEGCGKNSVVIINSEKAITEFTIPKGIKALTVPGTKIAMETIGKPIFNTAMMGAVAGVTDLIKFSSIRRAICQHFPPALAEVNIKAANTAYCYAHEGDKFCQLTPKVCTITEDDRKRLKVKC
ncbi:MAG: pyruvate ferredoxin oxidoreductase subunit gamma [Patescibacteria group bacterium]